MQLSNNNLSLLRSQPHKTDLWLSIYRPKTLMAARVTGSYTTGDYQISYYGVTTGSFASLYPDITTLVGTQAGQGDVGRIRMRSATGTYAVFAENGLQWQTGQYLTFIDYIQPEAVYPRIIQDPNNEENVIFYKDYDITYLNQNTIYGSFLCAGSHRAGFMQSGTASIFYSATGTTNVAGSSLTYSWIFEGGNPTGSTSLTPGIVTYNSTGHYKTRLRVTAANGAVDSTYRYVSLYDRPGNGVNTPVLKWELQELSGSRDQGGYTASIKLYENIGEIEPNALIVIFSDNWYGDTIASIGGNAINNSSIVFVGYVLSDSIQFNYKESYVEFQIGSISEMMKTAEGFSVSCESKASPSTWFQLQEMTVPKAMYHYLKWHSTILRTTDFQYTGDDRLVQYFDSDRGSLYDAVDSFMRDGMLGSLISDRQGKLWAEISPFGLEAPFSTIPKTFTYHKQDWIGRPIIQERRNSEMSFIELGGIAYYGVTSNTFSALLTNAPSTVPLYHGKSESPQEGLILISQQQLNNIAGNYLAHNNTQFPEISLSLAGNYNNLDIAPLERADIVIDQNDSVRGKTIQGLQYNIEGMEWSYNSKDQVFRPDITLRQIATGTAGQTVLIPAVPPDGGYSYPTLDLPPIPDFGGSTPVGPTVNTAVLFYDSNIGIVYSSNFDSGSPNYVTVNNGLNSWQKTHLSFMFVCPNGAFYVGNTGQLTNANRGTGISPFIARANKIGDPFVVLVDETNMWAEYPGNPTLNHAIYGVSFNALVPETIAFMMGEDVPTLDRSNFHIWIGANGSFTKGSNVVRIAINHGGDGMSFGDGKWVYVGSKAALGSSCSSWKFSSAGVLQSADGNSFGDISEGSAYRPSASLGTIYTLGWSNGKIHRTTDNGDSWTDMGDTKMNGGGGIALDPTGVYGMMQYDTAKKGRTTDAMTTFTALPNLPPGGDYVFACAGTISRWIAAKSVIRFSPDMGNTWINKEGDYLTTIAAVPNIQMIFVPGFAQTHAQVNT